MLSSRAPGRVEFVEVRKPRKKPPTWVGASQRARSSHSTLKPPKAPTDWGPDLVEFEVTENEQAVDPRRDGNRGYPRGHEATSETDPTGAPDPGEPTNDPRDYRREITPPPPRGPASPRRHPAGDDELELRAAMAAVMASVPPPATPQVVAPELDPQALQDAALAELRVALEASLSLRDDWLRESEAQLVELVSVIARRVIAREVRSDPGLVRSLVREGLAALGGADRVVVRLGEAFRGACQQLSDELESNAGNCQVLVDPELSEQGCVIETAYGRVDESLEARLDHVLGALTREDD